MNARTIPFWMTVAVAAALGLAAAAAPAMAQTQAEGSDRVVVPLSHPSQPARVNVSTVFGSITVSAYTGRDVVIETEGGRSRHEKPMPPEAQGMHRLTLSPAISADEDNNTVTVHMSMFNGGDGNLIMQVPLHTSLTLHTVNGGEISVTGVDGDLNVDDLNGEIRLNNVSGSILAHALNGRIQATVAALDSNKPSSFSSMNGTIDVTLPSDTRANLNMRTDHGDIYIDDGFNFQVSRTEASSAERHNGMTRVRINRTIDGALNGGGTEIRFQNFNGSIYIRKGH